MKLTEQFIQDKLKDLIGTKVGWHGSEADSRLTTAVREYAKENGLDPYQFRVETNRYSKWTLDITYKGYDIGSVDIKRTKDRKHYSYFGDYCDYTYKQFCIALWIYPEQNEDVETRIAEIEKLVEARNNNEAKKKEHGKEVIKLLKDTYNLDDYDVRKLIDYLHDNKYSITA